MKKPRSGFLIGFLIGIFAGFILAILGGSIPEHDRINRAVINILRHQNHELEEKVEMLEQSAAKVRHTVAEQLNDLIKEHPNTPQAKEAAELLKGLNKKP